MLTLILIAAAVEMMCNMKVSVSVFENTLPGKNNIPLKKKNERKKQNRSQQLLLWHADTKVTQALEKILVSYSKTHLLKDCLIWLLSLSPGGFSSLWTKNEKIMKQKKKTSLKVSFSFR